MVRKQKTVSREETAKENRKGKIRGEGRREKKNRPRKQKKLSQMNLTPK